jgi:DNA-binding transcriptional ArsR family regulator
MKHSTKAPVHHLPRVVRALKAMAHPVRLRMLAMLRPGELCVCQLTAVLDLAASTVSGHLADLRAAGLVHERKDGKWVHYRLTDDPDLSAVIRSALESLARDHQTDTDAATVRQVRRLPVETVSGGGFDLASATARGRRCCSANASPAARRSRPRMAAV